MSKIFAKFVTDSWIVDNDPGDEDLSVMPERRALVELHGVITGIGENPMILACSPAYKAGDTCYLG